jgi:hypothetical protein
MSGGDERRRPYTQITRQCQIREPAGRAPGTAVRPQRSSTASPAMAVAGDRTRPAEGGATRDLADAARAL